MYILSEMYTYSPFLLFPRYTCTCDWRNRKCMSFSTILIQRLEKLLIYDQSIKNETNRATTKNPNLLKSLPQVYWHVDDWRKMVWETARKRYLGNSSILNQNWTFFMFCPLKMADENQWIFPPKYFHTWNFMFVKQTMACV